MVSAIRDQEYGPVVLRAAGRHPRRDDVRAGGAVGRLDPGRRERVLRASVVGRLLDGYRGGTRHDLAALSDLVSTALDAVDQRDAFLEINPVIVGNDGVRVVDLIARP